MLHVRESRVFQVTKPETAWPQKFENPRILSGRSLQGLTPKSQISGQSGQTCPDWPKPPESWIWGVRPRNRAPDPKISESGQNLPNRQKVPEIAPDRDFGSGPGFWASGPIRPGSGTSARGSPRPEILGVRNRQKNRFFGPQNLVRFPRGKPAHFQDFGIKWAGFVTSNFSPFSEKSRGKGIFAPPKKCRSRPPQLISGCAPD